MLIAVNKPFKGGPFWQSLCILFLYARPMAEEWVLSLLRQCRKQRVKFFFKQWGGVRKATTGRSANDSAGKLCREVRANGFTLEATFPANAFVHLSALGIASANPT